MAWATPWTATTGQVVTAAQMNAIRDNLRFLKGLDGIAQIDNGLYADGAIRARQAGSTRYRSDHLVSSGQARVNAYDDTGAAYIPLMLDGDPVLLRPSAGIPGGVAVIGVTGINSATPVTVISSGVSRRWAAWGVAYHSGASGAFSGVTNTPNVQTTLYSDGTNILVAQASSGVLQVYRSGGSASFDAILFVVYQ